MIYLDNAATTAVDCEVLAEMMPCFSQEYANVASQHRQGREALSLVDIARLRVARAIGAKPSEIYFTSGGTESDAWALRGAAYAHQDKGRHIISSSIEHPAIRNNLRQLEKEGFRVTYLPVDSDGIVDISVLEKAIEKDTILISIMAANNEIGSVQDIAAIGKIARDRKIIFHSDAVQAMCSIPISVMEQNIDLLSISAHKFYGPKGAGALYIRNGVRIEKFLIGGGQERTMRSGTLNTPAIVGMGKAIEMGTFELSSNAKKLKEMRDLLIKRITSEIPNVKLNGHREKRLPNNVSFSFSKIEAEGILLMLDASGIAVSSGSACSSGSLQGSYVLNAIGVPEGLAQGTIRFTFGKYNNVDEIEYVMQKLKFAVERLRAFSPL